MVTGKKLNNKPGLLLCGLALLLCGSIPGTDFLNCRGTINTCTATYVYDFIIGAPIINQKNKKYRHIFLH